MGFFSFFSQEKQEQFSQLHRKLKSQFPELEDEQLELYASYAGTLARVAYADLKITKSEAEQMERTLSSLTKLASNEVSTIIKICIDDMKELGGIEDHHYTRYLSKNLEESQRADLLCSLFAIAAADENVDANEVEALRNITTGLNLSHQHFVAAKALVKDYLVSLNRGSR